MEGIISGDKEVMTQITQLSEKQAQEALAIQQAHGHGKGAVGGQQSFGTVVLGSGQRGR